MSIQYCTKRCEPESTRVVSTRHYLLPNSRELLNFTQLWITAGHTLGVSQPIPRFSSQRGLPNAPCPCIRVSESGSHVALSQAFWGFSKEFCCSNNPLTISVAYIATEAGDTPIRLIQLSRGWVTYILGPNYLPSRHFPSLQLRFRRRPPAIEVGWRTTNHNRIILSWYGPRRQPVISHCLTERTGKKVNQSRYRPGVAQRVPGSKGSQISWQRHRMVVGCQPYAPAAFTSQEILLVPISVRGWVDPRAIVRSEGFYINEKFQWHQLGSKQRPSDL